QGAFRDIRGNEPPLAKVQRLRKAASPALGPEMPGIPGYPGRDEWRPQRAGVRGGVQQTRTSDNNDACNRCGQDSNHRQHDAVGAEIGLQRLFGQSRGNAPKSGVSANRLTPKVPTNGRLFGISPAHTKRGGLGGGGDHARAWRPVQARLRGSRHMKAVIYARYSTDLQREASIEDQVRVCRQRIEREGWQLLATYSDAATSGASRLRPGFQKLLEDARAGAFNVVVAEALDRLSRDLEHIAALYKQLRFHGVRILTLAEGEISELHVGLKGTMNALFLKDLAAKTHRGLEGRVREGRSGGGICYGYDIAQEHDARGELIPGGRQIHDAEAAIVLRIFTEFANGKSPRRIALDLNKEGIDGPQGAGWGASTINGNAARGTGILNNELYIGRLVWNRLQYVKDPRTGKRVS